MLRKCCILCVLSSTCVRFCQQFLQVLYNCFYITTEWLCNLTAGGNKGSRVFSIIAKFFFRFFLRFSVYMITLELLHLAWWNFAKTCTLTISRILLNMKVIGQRSRSHGHDTHGQYLALSKAWRSCFFDVVWIFLLFCETLVSCFALIFVTFKQDANCASLLRPPSEGSSLWFHKFTQQNDYQILAKNCL